MAGESLSSGTGAAEPQFTTTHQHDSTLDSDNEKAAWTDKHERSSPSSEDLAAEYGIKESSLLRKLDLHIVPGVCILYLLSFLDRSNSANAVLDGLLTDLHMTGNQYDTGLSLFFVGYIALEVVWNLILKRVGPKIWLPSVTLVWGIVATLQGVIQYNGGGSGVAGWLVIRFILGLCEGGLFPGVVFFLSMFYKRAERQYRVALFFSAASLAGAFGGILAYGIGYMNGVGGYRGWRWIFIIEGLLTIVLAVGAYWYIPDWPSKAKFLTEDERALVHARLKADSDATQTEHLAKKNVIGAFKDPKVWLYSIGYTSLSLPLYTLSFFLPTIISELGYKAWESQLLTVPPYALATILTVIIAVISEKTKIRAPFIIGLDLLAIIGYCLLLSNTDPTKTPGVSYAGVFFCAAGIYPAVALVLSWPAINVSGQTKRATATALQITIGNIGAVIGCQLYRKNSPDGLSGPRFIVGHSVAMSFLVWNILIVSTLWWLLARINKKRDQLEASTAEVVDGEWTGDEDPRWRFRL